MYIVRLMQAVTCLLKVLYRVAARSKLAKSDMKIIRQKI